MRLICLTTLLLAWSTPAHAAETTLASPQAILIHGHRLYVVDTPHDLLHIVDLTLHVERTIPTGKQPVSLGADGDRIVVVNAGSGDATILDAATGAVIATLPTGAHPYRLAMDATHHRALIGNTYSNKVTVLDLKALTATQAPLGSTDILASQDGLTYLLGYENPNLRVADTDLHTTTLPTGMHLWGIATEPGRAYITRIAEAELLVIDTVTHAIHRIPTGQNPSAVAVNPHTHRAYVANLGDNTVTVIDTESLHAIHTVSTSKGPSAIAIDTQRNLIYTANTLSESITMIDGVTDRTEPLLAGSAPYAITIDEKTGDIFTANLHGRVFTAVTAPRAASAPGKATGREK